MPLNTLTGKIPASYKYYGQLHPVYTPMVIAYAVQSSWHAKVIEIKPPLQTVSAESIGPHAEVRPNPVTGIKKREYEIGNEYVPREPDIPCVYIPTASHVNHLLAISKPE